MSLRLRMAGFVAAAVSVTVLIVAFAAYRSTRAETLAEIDQSLRGRVPISADGELLGIIGPNPGGGGQGQGPGQGGQGQGRNSGSVILDDVVAQVLLRDGTVIPLGDGEVLLPVTPEDLAVATGTGEGRLRTVLVDDRPYRMITRRFGAPAAAVQIGRDLSESEAILDGLRTRLLLIGMAGAALAAVAGWYLAGRGMRPVQELTTAAERVATTGTLNTAIPVDRHDEIGRLAGAFNEMLAKLEESRVAQQRLVADASHELRTPLTSLRTNIELMASGRVADDARAEMLQDLTSEVLELGALVGELVDLATVGRAEEKQTEFDLAGVIEEVVSRAERRATQRFVVNVEPVDITGRRSGVARAISNLIDNAAKWSPPDGTIEVRLTRHGLWVDDDGPGIDEADLPHIFERFYRATKARSQPGSGLGLAIVSAVADDHGWSVQAKNRPEGGASVGLTFERD